jgi:hypothetical protein
MIGMTKKNGASSIGETSSGMRCDRDHDFADATLVPFGCSIFLSLAAFTAAIQKPTRPTAQWSVIRLPTTGRRLEYLRDNLDGSFRTTSGSRLAFHP